MPSLLLAQKYSIDEIVGCRAQRQTFDVARGAIRLEFLQICPAIPNLPRHRRAVEIDPVIGARERMKPLSGGSSKCQSRNRNRVARPLAPRLK